MSDGSELEPAGPSWTVVAKTRLLGRAPVLVQGEATDHGARLAFVREVDGAGLRVDLRVRTPVGVSLLRLGGRTDERGAAHGPWPGPTGASPPWGGPAGAAARSREPPGATRLYWSMVRGVPLGCPRDVVAHAVQWAKQALLAARGPAVEALPEEETRALLSSLFAVVRATTAAAVERCEPTAYRLAMRFLPHLRVRVYARLAGDATGRLAELAEACPGALVFALALAEVSESPRSVAAGERLLADVVAGRRLTHAIDDAVEAWLSSVPEYLVSRNGGRPLAVDDTAELDAAFGPDLSPAACEARRWAAALDPAASHQVRAAKRLLVRRAGPQVPTKALWLPPPAVLVPEDIPTSVRANARWYRVMVLHPVSWRPLPGVTPARQRAVSSFFSRNAGQLGRGSGRRLDARISDLVDYGRATGRWPVRATDWVRYVGESARWHAQFHQPPGGAAGDVVGRDGDALRPETALAAPLFDASTLATAEVGLAPIATVGALLEEGAEMQHCVVSRAVEALAGRVLLFRGVVAGERVTVELVRTLFGWDLGDVRRRRNALPSPRAMSLVRAWAAAAAELHRAADTSVRDRPWSKTPAAPGPARPAAPDPGAVARRQGRLPWVADEPAADEVPF